VRPELKAIALRARLRIRRNELADAQHWARDRQLSFEDEPSYLREYEHLTLARLLIAQHRAQPDADDAAHALSLLDRLRSQLNSHAPVSGPHRDPDHQRERDRQPGHVSPGHR
jgi:LuxR family maltose regulon positive regulatory protein